MSLAKERKSRVLFSEVSSGVECKWYGYDQEAVIASLLLPLPIERDEPPPDAVAKAKMAKMNWRRRINPRGSSTTDSEVKVRRERTDERYL